MIPRSALRGIQALRDAEDAAIAQGFADCETLVVVMLKSMSASEAAKIGLSTEPSCHGARSLALAEAALAVSLGQHRTDAYDPDELAKAHASALGRRGASKGGLAGTDAQNSARRANARKTKGLRFRCAGCGKETAGRLLEGGDGSFYYPRRHQNVPGEVCPGCYQEAEPLKAPEIKKARLSPGA